MGFKFQGFDLLHLDSSFSEDELLVRKTARDFVEDNLFASIPLSTLSRTTLSPSSRNASARSVFRASWSPSWAIWVSLAPTSRVTAAPECPTWSRSEEHTSE